MFSSVFTLKRSGINGLNNSLQESARASKGLDHWSVVLMVSTVKSALGWDQRVPSCSPAWPSSFCLSCSLFSASMTLASRELLLILASWVLLWHFVLPWFSIMPPCTGGSYRMVSLPAYLCLVSISSLLFYVLITCASFFLLLAFSLHWMKSPTTGRAIRYFFSLCYFSLVCRSQ